MSQRTRTASRPALVSTPGARLARISAAATSQITSLESILAVRQILDIRGVDIINNTAAGVTAYSSEESGDGFGIPGFTNNLSITGNRIVCPTSVSPHGILTTQGATNLEISGNYVEGCTPQNAIISDLYSGRVHDNIIKYQDMVNTDYTIDATSDPLLIPDGLTDTVALTGTNSFSHIFRFSQNLVGTGIGGIRIDIGGSGFINKETATITGCSTNPTGVARLPQIGPDI